MAERDAKQPTHRVYSVIRREGQDDFWLNLGIVFSHGDGKGFNIMLQALPIDGKLVCREIADDKPGDSTVTPLRSSQAGRGKR